jgi:hypothetical protein
LAATRDEDPTGTPSDPPDGAVPGPGDARDAENPTSRPTPEEQRERGQRAATELGAEAEDEIVEDDETDERPGTSGVQPGLPAE